MSVNCYNILIIGDSRVSRLETELRKTTLNLDFTVESLPGARFERITLKAMTMLAYYDHFHLVIITGGINDMSKHVHHPSRHALPRFGSVNSLADNTLTIMRTSIQKIKNITSLPVVLATLPGMDLTRYSPEYHELLAPLQHIFDDAITSINKQIRGINRLNNLRSLNLAYPVHWCKGKRGLYRNQYSLLHDGLHPQCLSQRQMCVCYNCLLFHVIPSCNPLTRRNKLT